MKMQGKKKLTVMPKIHLHNTVMSVMLMKLNWGMAEANRDKRVLESVAWSLRYSSGSWKCLSNILKRAMGNGSRALSCNCYVE